jgi:hypothetical protein
MNATVRSNKRRNDRVRYSLDSGELSSIPRDAVSDVTVLGNRMAMPSRSRLTCVELNVVEADEIGLCEAAENRDTAVVNVLEGEMQLR